MSSEGKMCLLMRGQDAVLLVNSDGKFVTPSVEKDSEICDLHQRVWHTTGLNVLVEQSFYNQSNTAVHVCSLDQGIAEDKQQLALPEWRQDSKAEMLQVVDLFLIDRKALANPETLVPLREAYVTKFNKIKQQE